MATLHGKRYQKLRILSCVPGSRLKLLALLAALSLAAAGCSGARATAGSADTSSQSATVSISESSEPSVRSDAPPLSVAVQAMPARHPQAEQALEAAREAMQKKQWTRLGQLVPEAAAEPLLGFYPRYWQLRQQLQDRSTPIPIDQIDHFFKHNPDPYLADRLKADWIIASAQAGDYSTVLQLGPVISNNPNVECARLQAMQQVQGQAVSAQQAMQTFRPAALCWTMLQAFQARGVIDWSDIQYQLRANLETANPAQARRLASLLFDAAQMKAYAALIANPRGWLQSQGRPATPAQTELVTLALSRMAREKDRAQAAAYIEKNWANAVPQSDIEWVWGQFGLVAALNTDPEAARWYRRSGPQRKTDYNHAWEVRSELLQHPIEWQVVDAAIQKMSPEQQAEPVWVYWRGRALEAQGHAVAAQQHFASIQHELNFYGQLANDELGQILQLPASPAPVTQAELAQARGNPGLQRSIRLFDLGWRPEAVASWNFALRGMNDRQLLASAELAREEAIFDRVINTSLQTKNQIDFRQRFIAPFEGRVTEKARQIQLDPSWVYGLIRQESRFITDARSRVGASGLMQLMPATAKWVAKKIGMNNFSMASVNDFDTNTVLGTQYLNMVLERLDGSEVLATAGYNAGPGRPVKWRARLRAPVEGAIFAETIPFTETRLYVKHVLSNAVYYSMMFTGQPQSLKQRLGTIVPRGATQVALP